jgi:hypothetical protein
MLAAPKVVQAAQIRAELFARVDGEGIQHEAFGYVRGAEIS